MESWTSLWITPSDPEGLDRRHGERVERGVMLTETAFKPPVAQRLVGYAKRRHRHTLELARNRLHVR